MTPPDLVVSHYRVLVDATQPLSLIIQGLLKPNTETQAVNGSWGFSQPINDISFLLNTKNHSRKEGYLTEKINAYMHGVHSMLFGTLPKSFNFHELPRKGKWALLMSAKATGRISTSRPLGKHDLIG